MAWPYGGDWENVTIDKLATIMAACFRGLNERLLYTNRTRKLFRYAGGTAYYPTAEDLRVDIWGEDGKFNFELFQTSMGDLDNYPGGDVFWMSDNIGTSIITDLAVVSSSPAYHPLNNTFWSNAKTQLDKAIYPRYSCYSESQNVDYRFGSGVDNLQGSWEDNAYDDAIADTVTVVAATADAGKIGMELTPSTFTIGSCALYDNETGDTWQTSVTRGSHLKTEMRVTVPRAALTFTDGTRTWASTTTYSMTAANIGSSTPRDPHYVDNWPASYPGDYASTLATIQHTSGSVLWVYTDISGLLTDQA